MTPAPFTSPLLSPLFGDPEASAMLDDAAFAAQMVVVEAALARAGARVGLVPAPVARRIDGHLATFRADPAALGGGTGSAGVPVPALVKAIQAGLEPDAARWVHWGATSQDIVDCAHMLQWRAVLDLLEERLGGLVDQMQAASLAHAETAMAGRTRSQIATPITFGLRIAQWAQPLIGLTQDLPHLRERLLRVQFGGAAGSASAVEGQGAALSAALAQELGLSDAACWHGDRSAVVALGAWLAGLCAALARVARDLIMMGRSEIAEARAGAGGGSSTMPQKSNPVAAEAMVTLADFVACLQPALARAAAGQEERDGAAWALEWLVLPQMGVATAAALRHAAGLMATLRADPGRMADHLALGHGSALAEAASFLLATHMPRPDAQELVKDALAAAEAAGNSLAEALARDPRSARLQPDWRAVLTPAAGIGPARDMAARIFARRG